MTAFNSFITAHLPPADDFESKFQFHPVEDLPPPDEFKPFPRIYPSKENRGIVIISQLYPWLQIMYWAGFLFPFLQWTQNRLGWGHTSDESRPHPVLHLPKHISGILDTILLISLLMTITYLPWTYLDAGSICVCVVCVLCDCAYMWVSNGVPPHSDYVTSDLFQCGMFWMCVRRRALPTHAHMHSSNSVFQ